MTATQTRNGSATDARITKLENDLALMAWLHAEQTGKVERLAGAVAAMMAQHMQPQMQQAILARLTGG
jgi:hypothetical protein